ncbi:MAG: hypothetical protein JHC72_04595 [Candidatus Nanopelagicus sp.]|jgi:Family of unknown function (DUF6504)|nr:hypothetical protein [Candidatus Nanopelagicus sp.]
MFERKSSPDLGQNNLAKLCLTTQSGEPVEFIYQGVRFHINQVLTTWLQSSNWWQQIDSDQINEQVSKYWQVEAAPIGALTTFEIEFNQADNSWQIRPSSRGKSNG